MGCAIAFPLDSQSCYPSLHYRHIQLCTGYRTKHDLLPCALCSACDTARGSGGPSRKPAPLHNNQAARHTTDTDTPITSAIAPPALPLAAAVNTRSPAVLWFSCLSFRRRTAHAPYDDGSILLSAQHIMVSSQALASALTLSAARQRARTSRHRPALADPCCRRRPHPPTPPRAPLRP